MFRINGKTSISLLAFLLIVFVAFSAQAADKVLTMATTTSTDNTGLLDYLAPNSGRHGHRAALDGHRHRQSPETGGELRCRTF